MFGCPGQQMVQSWSCVGRSSPLFVWCFRLFLLVIVVPIALLGALVVATLTFLFFPVGLIKWIIESRQRSSFRAYTVPLVEALIQQKVTFYDFVGGAFGKPL